MYVVPWRSVNPPPYAAPTYGNRPHSLRRTVWPEPAATPLAAGSFISSAGSQGFRTRFLLLNHPCACVPFLRCPRIARVPSFPLRYFGPRRPFLSPSPVASTMIPRKCHGFCISPGREKVRGTSGGSLCKTELDQRGVFCSRESGVESRLLSGVLSLSFLVTPTRKAGGVWRREEEHNNTRKQGGEVRAQTLQTPVAALSCQTARM